MRNKLLLLSSFLVFLISAGCATPYQPMLHEGNFPEGGYTSRQIGETEYEIYFTGNRFTSLKRAKEYWHRRAGEICKPLKYSVRSFSVQEKPEGQSLLILRGEVLCK